MPATALIVEDEIFVALDLERILTDAGYHVAAIAADRSSAIESAEGCSFALVDINLRDGPTGPELAERLAQSGVKVIFVTANPAQIGSSAGAIGYVRKPFNDAAILAAAALASDPAGAAPVHKDVVLLPVSGG